MYTLQFFYTYRDAFRSLFMKKIVFTFGRFNPPTTGHQLLANKVKDIAQKRAADYKIFGSSSQDAKRNPLSPTDKFRFMKKILKGFNVAVDRKNKTPFQVLQQLSDDGYEDVTMVVGSDRVEEFKKNMSRYIGKKGYENISKFNVVSAGDRDPDAEGVTGMSASKMRAAASEGNFDAFRLGMPSHVSERDAMGLFKAIRKGMGIRGKISESTSWFDYEEFSEFVNNMEEPQEMNEALTLSGRRKLSMRMKKTAKKRARVRKMREKRRKTKTQLVAKATKTAIKKIRARFHKGRAWNDVSYMERIRIGEKMKKKKKAIQRVSKRLIPAMHKAEKERLQKVKNRMTSKEPAKAIAPTNEHIDMMFEEYIEEVAPKYQRAMRTAGISSAGTKVNREKQKAQDRGQDAKKVDAARKRGERANGQTDNRSDKQKKFPNLQANDPVEIQRGDQIEIVLFKDAKIDQIKSSRPVKAGQAKSISKKPGFVCGPTSQALGVDCEKITQGRQGGAGEQELKRGVEPTETETPEQKKAREAAEKEQAKLDSLQRKSDENDLNKKLHQDEVEDEQLKADIAAVEAQHYANPIGEILGIKTAKPPKDKKAITTKNGQFEDWHEAVSVEPANVAVGNGCHELNSQEEMMMCLEKSGISKEDIKTLGASPTLIPAAMRMHDVLKVQFGDDYNDMKWYHTGTGMGSVELSSTFDDAGASNTTPKTDLIAENTKTGQVYRMSMKIGPGQLMSAQAGEALGTIRVAMNRIKGCKGYDRETKTGTDCQRDFGDNQKLIDEMHEIKKVIEDVFVKTTLGEGTGPIGWWTSGRIGGAKPNWWDKMHPDWPWEEAVGKDPNELTDRFKNLSERDRKSILDAKEKMNEVQDRLNAVFNEGEFGELIKQHVMYEAMTGCGKYCPDCCGVDICDDCDSPHMATHLIVANKDGTNAGIEEIGKPGSEFMKKASPATNTRVDFKTTQPKRRLGGWISELSPEISDKVLLPTRSKKNMTALKDAHKNQSKEWEDRKLNKTQDEELRKELGKAGFEVPEYAFAGMPKRMQTNALNKMSIPGKRKKGIGRDAFLSLSKREQTKILKNNNLEYEQFFGSSIEQQKKYLSKEHKRGKYTAASTLRMGMGKPELTHKRLGENYTIGLLTEDNGIDGGNWAEAMEWIGNDPSRLAEFLELEPDISAEHENYADTFKDEKVTGQNEIQINGKVKKIPIFKDTDYKDYQKDFEERDLDESFRMLTEPDILDRLVTQLKDKGMDNDKANAIARSQLQKHGVLKKGTDDLTAHGEKRNAMGAAGRAKDRAAKKDGKSPKDYNYNPRTNIATQKEDCGCMNEDVQLDEYGVHTQKSGTSHSPSGGKYAIKLPKSAEKRSERQKQLIRNAIANSKKESVELDEARRKDVYAVVNRKTGKIVSSKLTRELAHKHMSNEKDEKNFSIILDPDAKIGDTKKYFKFKESTTHGVGSFANTDIEEGTSLSLYLLDLMEDTPTYQRTDFCRFTNHSHKNANLTLERVDGSLHAKANRDIQEGEELFIDYFHVLDNIGTDINIIEDILRWTDGYENVFIPEDTMESFAHELAFLVSIGDCPELSEDFLMMLPKYPHQEQTHDKDFFDKTLGREKWQPGDPPKPVGLNQIKEDEDPVKRAKRLKAYNARPEQRARRSARTNERNKRIRKGQLAVGDGKDIDHKDGNPLNNSSSNISITSVKYNRGRNNNKGRANEEHGAGEEGTKKLLKKYLKDTPNMTIDSLFKKEMG